jgi:hypothetical protein
MTGEATMYRIDYTTDKLVEPLCEADLNWEPCSRVPGIDYENLASVLSILEDMRVMDDGKGRYRVMREGAVEPAADDSVIEAAEAWRQAESVANFTGRSASSELEALRRAVDDRKRRQREGERRVA